MESPPTDKENVLRVIAQLRPTIFCSVPGGYSALLGIENLAEKHDLSSIRLCVSAGEALPAPLWTRWKKETGLSIIDGIGSTENFHIFISNRPGDIRPGSSGKPVRGYQVRIVDQKLEDVVQGEIGDLWVKGETAATHYLHQAERSKEVFRGKWLVTGDKYYVDEDGYYWHAGRSDDMLKIGGNWVSPVEIETVLLYHEAVLECAVVTERDQHGLAKIVAKVRLSEKYEASDRLAQTLIEHSEQHLAHYKRPRRVDFVEELPKTATGKIQRFKLREMPEAEHRMLSEKLDFL
jgi:acyl-coenzyme A synthetase/AMP-(fatty) acid ligase